MKLKKRREEIIYTYEVELEQVPGENTHEVEISFINNEFDACRYKFEGFYSEKEWEILGEISIEVLSLIKFHKDIERERQEYMQEKEETNES